MADEMKYSLDLMNAIYSEATGSRVMIAGLSKKPLTALLTQDFNMSAEAYWQTPFESAGQDMDILNKTYTAIQQGLNAAGANVPSALIKSLKTSIYSYGGSKRPEIPLDLVFVSLKPTDDVRVYAKALMSGIYPTEASILTLTPPLGYNADLSSPSGTLSVSIGRWFRAHRLLLMSANYSFSKATIANGTPLYMSSHVVLAPWKVPTVGEVQSYFSLGATK